MAGLDYIRAPDIGAEYTAYVSPSYPTDEFKHRFPTIQAGIDFLTAGGVVSVAPGTYTEQIHSKSNITIRGYTSEGPPTKKSTILYNTGADANHYPLRGDDSDCYIMNNITIETNAGGVIGKINSHDFSGCVFSKGHFIEATKNANMLLGLDNCSFLESKAFDLTGIGSGGLRAMTIIGCFFGDHATHLNFASTHTNTLAVMKNCIFHKSYPDIGGNWALEMSDCHILGSSRSVISTTNKITFIKCILSNGLHFTSNPDTIIQLCTFNDDCGYPITGADITATVDVTDVDYVANIQQNGLIGKFKYRCPDKPVGCNVINRYMTVQDAIDSVTTQGTIELHEDFTGLAELSVPINTKLVIDGQREHSLSFAGDIVELGAGVEISFIRFINLSGGNIEVNGNNAVLAFESTQYVNAYITLTSGTSSFCVLYNSSMVAASGHPAITVNNTDTLLVTGYSRVKGITGYPAILFTVDADLKFKSKFSTLIHGDNAGNSPLVSTVGAGKIDISVYSTGLNATWDANNFNNTIVSAGNITDASINF